MGEAPFLHRLTAAADVDRRAGRGERRGRRSDSQRRITTMEGSREDEAANGRSRISACVRVGLEHFSVRSRSSSLLLLPPPCSRPARFLRPSAAREREGRKERGAAGKPHPSLQLAVEINLPPSLTHPRIHCA